MNSASALETARSLVANGDIDGAVRVLLRAGAPVEAAQVLAQASRFNDAGHLLMDSLGVGPNMVRGLDPARKRVAQAAAEYFVRGGDNRSAAQLFAALGDPRGAAPAAMPFDPGGAAQPGAAIPGGGSRIAAQQLEQAGNLAAAFTAYERLRLPGDAARVAEAMNRPADAARLYEAAGQPYAAARCYLTLGDTARSLDNMCRVPKDHEHYRPVCIQAIRLASDLNVFDFRIDQFLARFTSTGPQDEREIEAFYVLAKMYVARDFPESAIAAFRKIIAVRPGYRDAQERLSALEADTKASTMAFEAIVRQDAQFRGQDAPRGAKPRAEPLPDLPDLPDLPPVPQGTAIIHSAPAHGGHASQGTLVQGQSSQMPTHVVASVPSRGFAAVPGAPVSPPLAAGAVAAPTNIGHGAAPASAVVASPHAPAHVAPASAPLDLSNLPPGFLVAGRYMVEKKLGEGGMAAVYRVADQELGETNAMKFFFMQEDASLLTRFRQELTLTRKLAHPNIVRLYDIGMHEGYRFLTMELLDGVELRSIMDAGPMDPARALKYLVQACNGLAVAHEAGVIHRDLKPANMFVTRDGDVLKIMDFGIAKGKPQSAGGGITVQGFIAGTPTYMSPEQISDFGSVTHLSDLYTLGIIAYEMFTGSVPFPQDDMMGILSAHLTQEPEPLRARAPHLPAELEDVVMRLLSKKPAGRVQSCRDLASYFKEIQPQPKVPQHTRIGR